MTQAVPLAEVAYEIEHELTDVDELGWIAVVARTGRSWFRCSCGFRVEDEFGGPMPTNAVIEQADDHLMTDHPEVTR
ncbi:hypothetical protein [Streptosporangium lutulentum]|uniref:Uncharacterized protein n=1 Tax=Streptosporangium lutulentum TaxID=1461250 RepID=A0ABT9Q951_9ACTN|nr:hypothetical protein [Streptosporangium lutulentum]MDP9843272.1 hypothetical protein [Streptosporangium lutulentum]